MDGLNSRETNICVALINGQSYKVSAIVNSGSRVVIRGISKDL